MRRCREKKDAPLDTFFVFCAPPRRLTRTTLRSSPSSDGTPLASFDVFPGLAGDGGLHDQLALFNSQQPPLPTTALWREHGTVTVGSLPSDDSWLCCRPKTVTAASECRQLESADRSPSALCGYRRSTLRVAGAFPLGYRRSHKSWRGVTQGRWIGSRKRSLESRIR